MLHAQLFDFLNYYDMHGKNSITIKDTRKLILPNPRILLVIECKISFFSLPKRGPFVILPSCWTFKLHGRKFRITDDIGLFILIDLKSFFLGEYHIAIVMYHGDPFLAAGG